MFEVVLRPNPELTPSQQETIAMDYGMEKNRAVVLVRCAMLYYFEKRLRLDVDVNKDRLAEKPIIIENKSEFIKARDTALV